ncbi:MAG: hypothetical protein M3Y45_01980 [Actinomycetota bacterium]|nr:hypothetical protein [Actinomycetota bacterium]
MALLAAFGVQHASASSLQAVGADVQYQAAAGETNSLEVKIEGSEYVFTDAPGVTITAGAGCSVTLGIGRCPVGPTRLQVNLSDGDDTARIDQSIHSPLTNIHILGGPGADRLTNDSAVNCQQNGEAGNDSLTGGPASDYLLGDDGDDLISGGPGQDQLFDGPGTDQVEGGPGEDGFRPTSAPDGADRFRGGPDRDRIDFFDRTIPVTVSLNDVADDGASCPGAGCENDDIGSDIERVSGTRGPDSLTGSAGPESISGDDGDDVINGLDGPDDLSGGVGNDTVSGGGGNDELNGGSGADALEGGAGDDVVRPDFTDQSTDTVGGGPGFDMTETDLYFEPVRISLNGLADDGIRNPDVTSPPDNVKGDIEGLFGSDGADLLTGNGSENLLIGGGGADRLLGRGGPDEIQGGRGADVLDGGRGPDLLVGGSGPDRFKSRDSRRDELRCGAGVDRVVADRKDRRGPDCDRVRVARGKGKKR